MTLCRVALHLIHAEFDLLQFTLDVLGTLLAVNVCHLARQNILFFLSDGTDTTTFTQDLQTLGFEFVDDGVQLTLNLTGSATWT